MTVTQRVMMHECMPALCNAGQNFGGEPPAGECEEPALCCADFSNWNVEEEPKHPTRVALSGGATLPLLIQLKLRFASSPLPLLLLLIH